MSLLPIENNSEYYKQQYKNKDIWIETIEKENKKLKAFYDYWSDLYGQGLEIANWHLNGDLEPFDDFFDSAEDEMAKIE